MKKKATENFLEKVPVHGKRIARWTADAGGVVTLEIDNKGVFNRLAQLLLKKPKISYIHLDATGSFVWPLVDGKNDISYIGTKVDEHFGESAHPLYERLAKYFQILESYGFIEWVK